MQRERYRFGNLSWLLYSSWTSEKWKVWIDLWSSCFSSSALDTSGKSINYGSHFNCVIQAFQKPLWNRLSYVNHFVCIYNSSPISFERWEKAYVKMLCDMWWMEWKKIKSKSLLLAEWEISKSIWLEWLLSSKHTGLSLTVFAKTFLTTQRIVEC